MNLVEAFYEYAEKLGVSKEDIIKEKGDGFTMLSFGEQGEPNVIYYVILLMYDDNDAVEIYIRKAIETEDELSTLQQLNRWNAEYCGMSFFKQENAVNVKIYCKTAGDLNVVLQYLVQGMDVAKTEFPNIH